MEQNNLNTLITKAQRTNKLYIRLLIGAVIIILIQAAANMILANRQTIIVQVPASSPENALWIKSNMMSVDYLNLYARDIVSLGLNFSPETVDTQFGILLNLFTPSLRSILVSDLKETSTRIKANGISQTFFVDSVKVILATQTVYIRGFKKEYVNTQEIQNKEQIYRIQFKTNDFTGKVNEFMLLSPEKDVKEIKDVGI